MQPTFRFSLVSLELKLGNEGDLESMEKTFDLLDQQEQLLVVMNKIVLTDVGKQFLVESQKTAQHTRLEGGYSHVTLFSCRLTTIPP
jgi:hypothetical protein